VSELKRTHQGDKDVPEAPDHAEQDRPAGSRTAGTDRDLDESGESKNQGHGHDRQGDRHPEGAGHSERVVTDRDREDRDLGGPGGP
jgi:hypothetical protein